MLEGLVVELYTETHGCYIPIEFPDCIGQPPDLIGEAMRRMDRHTVRWMTMDSDPIIRAEIRTWSPALTKMLGWSHIVVHLTYEDVSH